MCEAVVLETSVVIVVMPTVLRPRVRSHALRVEAMFLLELIRRNYTREEHGGTNGQFHKKEKKESLKNTRSLEGQILVLQKYHIGCLTEAIKRLEMNIARTPTKITFFRGLMKNHRSPSYTCSLLLKLHQRYD